MKKHLLKSNASVLFLLVFAPIVSGQIPANSSVYDALNSDKYLSEYEVVTRIEDERIFTEGPAVDRDGDAYFTNVPAGKILKWDQNGNNLVVFRANSRGANGLRFTPTGELLACEGQPAQLTKTDMRTGEMTVLADGFQGKGLQALNDLDYDSKGRIYVSSRSSNPDLEKMNKRSVYRIDPDGSIDQLLAEPQVDMPNGIVISPDDKVLYLIEAHSGENRNRCVLAFDLLKDGTLSNRRVLYEFYPGRSGDGMAIDAKGNLYVAAGLHQERGTSETLDTRPGIHVISPKGKLLAFRETPEDTITNCSFGGSDLKTLYVTCGSYLLSFQTKIPGKKSYMPVN